jgi:hypothetical protein
MYTIKYPRNPNQVKINPEFFSKKVGDKLMKEQSTEEMLDSNSIIKKANLFSEEKAKLQQ